MTPAELGAYITPVLSGANLAVLVLVLYRVTELEKDFRNIHISNAKTNDRVTRIEAKLETLR